MTSIENKAVVQEFYDEWTAGAIDFDRPRSWLPAQRFRGPGRYTITLRAQDSSGRTSLPAQRTFRR